MISRASIGVILVTHSTEAALLKLFNDLFCYMDESRFMMYIGLDLSAAFDIIDHQFLIEIAKKIGLHSVVSIFIESYLPNRSPQVIITECLSGDVTVETGVPQESILDSLVFLVSQCTSSVIFSQCTLDDILIQPWFRNEN